MPTAEEIQAKYYADTASNYDKAHVAEFGEHERALQWIVRFCRGIKATSALDVGAGTGRTMTALRAAMADESDEFVVRGIEPVEELALQAYAKGIPKEDLQIARGETLPYEDGAFDVVMATGVLHHVPDPAAVIAEMTRVARKAVFISDANRFGQGSVPARLVKAALGGTKLWPAFDWVRTKGKRYQISEGDGLFYSYSVYDNLTQLNGWAERVVMVPVRESAEVRRSVLGTFGPLLSASVILVCAFKEAPDGPLLAGH